MSDSESSDLRDRKLADILERLMDSTVEKRPPLQELTAAHPELADELRDLWGAVMVADAVAGHSDDSQTTTPLTNSSSLLETPSKLGDFALQEEIGRGGMGVIYRARQQSLQRDVAVKLILMGSKASATDQQRFKTEVAAAARLDHPHIVPIYDFGVDGNWQYYGMRLIEGHNLTKEIAEGPVPERDAAKLVMTVARAIQYAHEQGVIHRDLKPANILIDSQGMPHVSDFGLAKEIESTSTLTETGAILGTPSYMSPEQANGGRGVVGPASDVYSLGAILYALLTGRPPFQSSSPVDTVLMVLEQDPLPPRLLNQRISRDLELIVLKALQKPTDLRYSTASDLANDLKAFLTNEPIAARSGHISDVVARVFRETHHATVLENWGVLWMWHAAVLLAICLVTNWFHLLQTKWEAMSEPWPYLALWGGCLAIWAPTFWALRHRAGPVTAVEREIAHAWGGSIVAVILLFVVESVLELPVLTLSPVLGLINGMVFAIKAGILAGSFYIHAAVLFATALLMAWMQRIGWPYGITFFGLVSAATFFVPGWKYFRQSRRTRRDG